MDQWKVDWDDTVNNERVRRRLADVKNAGTLYADVTEDEGHFAAYEVREDGVRYIFNPAAPGHRFGGPYFADEPGVLLDLHPQTHREDTFCQTWTLAWLMSDLRPLVEKGGLVSLFQICQAIARRLPARKKKLMDQTLALTFEEFCTLF